MLKFKKIVIKSDEKKAALNKLKINTLIPNFSYTNSKGEIIKPKTIVKL